MGAVREAVGNAVDICVEIHRQMTPAESIWLGRRLEQFHPYFYEDPMLPDSPARMADVQQQCNIPIATGERFTTIFEYQQLLEAKGAAYVRPDVCLCGGLTGSKKVAAMAEAQHVKVIPHNPLSPISTAACIQLDAAIPNFALQEYTGESHPPKSDLLVNPLELKEPDLIAGEGAAIQGDAMEVVRQLGEVELAYLDPPYNQHRYFTNYHVWETLIRWDEPEHYGVACKRVDARDAATKSVFNAKATMASAFADLLQRVRAEVVVVSYNDESWIARDEMVAALDAAGHEQVRVLEFDYKRYVGAQIGIHSPTGQKVGEVKRLRNVEQVFIAGPSARLAALSVGSA